MQKQASKQANEQAKEGFCCQGDTLINTIKLTLLKVKESSETIIYLN